MKCSDQLMRTVLKSNEVCVSFNFDLRFGRGWVKLLMSHMYFLMLFFRFVSPGSSKYSCGVLDLHETSGGEVYLMT